MEIIYEDNHLLVVSKAAGELVQGDKTGDICLLDTLKDYLKEKYHKPGRVFLGAPHRLDRPVSGIVVFAKTSKALSRLCDMFACGEVEKTYHALVGNRPPQPEGTLRHYLLRNEKENRSYAKISPKRGSKEAILSYRLLSSGDRVHLVEVKLHTGRHHQIRCQMAAIGSPIRGDLKYGAPRSNPDGSICLHAHQVHLIHPVSKEPLTFTAPYPAGLPLWHVFD